MEKIKVELSYPDSYNLDNKVLELNQIELTALLNSKEVGSENRYFKLGTVVFEDLNDEYMVTVLLEEK